MVLKDLTGDTLQLPEESRQSGKIEPLRASEKPGLLSRAARRASRSFQLRNDIGFAVVWTTITGTALLLPLWLRGHRSLEDFLTLAAIWVTGALLAGLFARFATRFIVLRDSPVKRFAAMIFFLLVLTAGFTAFLFMLEYRSYYAQWHEPVFSIGWIVQFIFTGANSVYLFTASALHRIVTPANMVIVLLLAWMFKPVHLKSD